MHGFTPQEIVELLGLQPLQDEGGMYREMYRSSVKVDGRNAGTAIYFLLTDRSYSHLHRLDADEVYHFYLGDPIDLLQLFPDGTHRVTRLGHDLRNHQVPQLTVPAGTWQGSRLVPGGKLALMGTTMTPAFSPECYEHASADELIAQYPDAAQYIQQLTGQTIFI